MCVCLPFGFVPCVCLPAFWNRPRLATVQAPSPPFVLYPPASLPSPSGGRRAVVMEPPGRCRHVGAGEEPPVDSSTTCCCSGKLEEGRAQAKVLVGEAARAWRPPRGLPPHPGRALARLPPTWPPGYFPVPGQGQETGSTRWLPRNQWPVAHLVVIAK